MLHNILTGVCGGLCGLYIGASQPDKVIYIKNKVFAVVQGEDANTTVTGAKAVEMTAEQLLLKAVALTKESGEFAVLSTVDGRGAPHSTVRGRRRER